MRQRIHQLHHQRVSRRDEPCWQLPDGQARAGLAWPALLVSWPTGCRPAPPACRASDKCQREKRKTINGDDLLWAVEMLRELLACTWRQLLGTGCDGRLLAAGPARLPVSLPPPPPPATPATDFVEYVEPLKAYLAKYREAEVGHAAQHSTARHGTAGAAGRARAQPAAQRLPRPRPAWLPRPPALCPRA